MNIYMQSVIHAKIHDSYLNTVKRTNKFRNERGKSFYISGQNLSEVFLRKGVLKICGKFTRELPCRSVISIKLLCNFIEITLLYGFSSVIVLHIFKTPFLKNTSGRLLLINGTK